MQFCKSMLIGSFFIIVSQSFAMSLDEELFDAVKNSDVDKVNDLLKKGANPNAQQPNGDRPLNLASQHGNREIVRELLAHNANPNALDQYNETPVERAWHKYDIIRMLVENGADPNGLLNRKTDERLLEAVVKNNDKKFVTLLLEKGANPNAENKEKDTALHLAVFYEASPEIIAALLEKGANPNLINKSGKTPLQMALEQQLSLVGKMRIRSQMTTGEYAALIAQLEQASAKFPIGQPIVPIAPVVKPPVQPVTPPVQPTGDGGLVKALNELTRSLGILEASLV